MFSISGTSGARFNAPYSTVTANSQQNIVLLLLYDCTCTVYKEFTDIIIAHIRTPDKNNVLSAVCNQALSIPLQKTNSLISFFSILPWFNQIINHAVFKQSQRCVIKSTPYKIVSIV